MESLFREIRKLKEDHPEFKLQLDIYEAVLKAQEPLISDPSKGRKSEISLETLQKEVLEKGKPISFLLRPRVYDYQKLGSVLKDLVRRLRMVGEGEPLIPADFEKRAIKSLLEIIENLLKGDFNYFKTKGNKIDIDPTLFWNLAETLIQPSLIDLASQVDQEKFLDVWGEVPCPVCGRIPFLVLKNEEEPWRFRCLHCGAEYAMDIFKCPNCGNNDPLKIGFLIAKDREAFEIGYCMGCNCYVKIINKKRLKKPIPRGLEDLYTHFLDEIAMRQGLKRLDGIFRHSHGP